MRIGVDGRSLAGAGAAGARGVAHYTNALLRALARAHPEDELHVLVPGGRPGPRASWPDGVHVHPHRLPSRLLFGPAAVVGRPRLDRMLPPGLDLLWAPAPAPLACSQQPPLALTVHDLSWVARPHDFTAYERLWHRLARLERLGRRAARILTVSQATRRAVLERWPVAPERVTVVPLGVHPPAGPPEPARVEAVRRRLRLPPRFFLFVGALEPRKAPDLLVRAHARARRAGLDSGLVLAGGGRLRGALAGGGVHLLGRVSDGDLDVLYREAVALVMPSWLEGFGLPPLEAAVRGTPAVVSDLEVFAETVGDGALRFAPGDETALAEALVAVEGDGDLRRRLVDGARTAAAGLTWERAARETRAVLAAGARAA